MGTSIQPKECYLHAHDPVGPEYIDNLQKRPCFDQRATMHDDQFEFRMELTITVGIFQQLHLDSYWRSYERNLGIVI